MKANAAISGFEIDGADLDWKDDDGPSSFLEDMTPFKNRLVAVVVKPFSWSVDICAWPLACGISGAAV